MEEITLDCIHRWQSWRPRGLLNPHECPKQKEAALQSAFASNDGPTLMSHAYMSEKGDKFCKLDIATLTASHGACVGEVWFHCSRAGEELTCVSLWQQVSLNIDKRIAQFRVCDSPTLIPSRDLVRPVICKVYDGIATVLLPFGGIVR